ncbi:MAG: hypothetical protein GWP69_07660 [Gammaproteobacteria bacterium]|jgi:hypothetical protein|nr:hypothetical protein [Gammaproteobacteria bacterium]
MNETRSTINKLFALCIPAILVFLSLPAVADSVIGTYRGFLAFDHDGKEIRESMVMSFFGDGNVIMGAEEGHDEAVNPDTGLVTKNDVESTNLGVWRKAGDHGLEFGSQQYRAGSAFCAPVNAHGPELLSTCSFILTARLEKDAKVRGEHCDLGGVGGGFGVQSVDGKVTESNPFELGLKIDYCLQKLSVDGLLKLVPVE